MNLEALAPATSRRGGACGTPSAPALLLADAGCSGALRSLVQDACADARLALMDCRTQPVVPAELQPVAVLGVLASGERTVPEPGARLAASTGLPHLLLCHDELVDPVVELDDGRLLLLGAPLTRARLAERLRRLRPATAAPVPAAIPRHELRGPGWWASCLGRPPALPRLVPEGILVLPAAGREHPALAGDGPIAERFARTARELGDGGLVWLDPGERRWHLQAPRPGGVLVLSPDRLPSRWRLPADRRQHACRACASDLVLAWSGGEPSAVGTGLSGPEALEAIALQIAAGTGPEAALLMEVRS